MNDKYIYTGPKNTRCPICNKIIADVGPPVIIFIGGKKHIERRWCMSCFNTIRSMDHRDEDRITDVIIPELTKMVEKLIPSHHAVRGYWFATVPKQGLTLVMEAV